MDGQVLLFCELMCRELLTLHYKSIMFWQEDREQKYLKQHLELQQWPFRALLQKDFFQGQHLSIHSLTQQTARKFHLNVIKPPHQQMSFDLEARTGRLDPYAFKVKIGNYAGYHSTLVKAWGKVYKDIRAYGFALVSHSKLQHAVLGWVGEEEGEKGRRQSWNVRGVYKGGHFGVVGRFLREFGHGMVVHGMLDTDIKTTKQNNLYLELGNRQDFGGLFALIHYKNLSFEQLKFHMHNDINPQTRIATSVRLHKSTYINSQIVGQYKHQNHLFKAKFSNNFETAFTHIVRRDNVRFGWSVNLGKRMGRFGWKGFGYRLDLNV